VRKAIPIVFSTALAALALPAAATGASGVLPPGNSAVNQYTEAFPTTSGGKPIGGDREQRSPGEVLGRRNAKRLESLGPQGRAAALAAASVPGAGGKGSSDGEGGGGGGGGEGSSEAGDVLSYATGTTSSGPAGPLLAIVIVAALVLSLAYLWQRRGSTGS